MTTETIPATAPLAAPTRDPTAGYGPVYAALAFLHFALLYLTVTRALDPFFNDAQHRLGPGTDFLVFYNAGTQWLAGHGIYGHGPAFGFRYHPLFAAVVGGTLGGLPKDTGYAVWVALQELAFFGLAGWLYRRAADRPTVALALVALWTVFTPFYLEVFMGNDTFLATILLFPAFQLMSTDRHPWLWVALVIASIVVKPVGLVFLPLFLLRGKYAQVGVIVGVVAASAVPFFVADPAGFRTFLNVNLHAIPRAGWVVHAGSQGFHGLVAAFLTRMSGVPTQQLSSFDQLPYGSGLVLTWLPVVLVGTSALASWRVRDNLGLGVFLWASTYLLGYKDVWEHSYTFAALALYWLYASGTVSWKVVLSVAVIVGAPTAFVFYDVALPPGPKDPEHHWSFVVSMLHHSTKSVPYLVLYGWVVARCLRGDVGTTPPSAASTTVTPHPAP